MNAAGAGPGGRAGPVSGAPAVPGAVPLRRLRTGFRSRDRARVYARLADAYAWLLLAAVAAAVWWGCRTVLPGPVLAAAALVLGYGLVLPLASTLRQLSSGPGLRAQFAPRDRWLGRASAATCLLGAAAWTAVITGGLTVGGAMSHAVLLAVIIPVGIGAAALRTVTRPTLDYTAPLVPTPMGDLPLDLWRQLLRGPLLLTMFVLLVLAVR